ncbi:MAG: DUF2170 family protein, partial [Marinobacter nauticus]|nr:DUF2170 family protein [Marinobacter nauticus]
MIDIKCQATGQGSSGSAEPIQRHRKELFVDTQSLTLALGDATHAGRTFDVMPIAGEEPVLQVIVSGAEETPVYITVTDTQILCLAYL